MHQSKAMAMHMDRLCVIECLPQNIFHIIVWYYNALCTALLFYSITGGRSITDHTMHHLHCYPQWIHLFFTFERSGADPFLQSAQRENKDCCPGLSYELLLNCF